MVPNDSVNDSDFSIVKLEKVSNPNENEVPKLNVNESDIVYENEVSPVLHSVISNDSVNDSDFSSVKLVKVSNPNENEVPKLNVKDFERLGELELLLNKRLLELLVLEVDSGVWVDSEVETNLDVSEPVSDSRGW